MTVHVHHRFIIVLSVVIRTTINGSETGDTRQDGPSRVSQDASALEQAPLNEINADEFSIYRNPGVLKQTLGKFSAEISSCLPARMPKKDKGMLRFLSHYRVVLEYPDKKSLLICFAG